MSIEIRRLRASDAQDYRTIRLAALRTEPDAFGSVHADEAERAPDHFAERVETSVVFGAYDAGHIVGMAGLKPQTGPKDSHKGFVWGVYVEAAWRCAGTGSALMSALIEAGRECVEQLTLTVVAGNTSALAFYERLGFVIYGVEPRALKTAAGYADEVLMVKMLATCRPSADRVD